MTGCYINGQAVLAVERHSPTRAVQTRLVKMGAYPPNAAKAFG